jgi:hypothetical protein
VLAEQASPELFPARAGISKEEDALAAWPPERLASCAVGLLSGPACPPEVEGEPACGASPGLHVEREQRGAPVCLTIREREKGARGPRCMFVRVCDRVFFTERSAVVYRGNRAYQAGPVPVRSG